MKWTRYICGLLLAWHVAGVAFAAGEASLKLPPCERLRLTNGLTLLLLEQHKVPMVSVSVLVRAGVAAEPAGREGLASLTADLLRRGTASRSADAIDAQLDFIGATLAWDAGYDFVSGGADFLKKDQTAALDLLADILLYPVFPQAEFTKRVQQVVDGLKEEKDEPDRVIGKYFRAFLFGGHPYGRPAEGDESSLASLARDEVARFYAANYRPDTTILAVAGDFSAAAMRGEIASRFEAWTRPPPAPTPAVSAPPPVPGRRLLLVDKPDATQTYFRVGNVGIGATNADRVAIELVNTVFGGRFTSLLNDALRVNSGYTYGASSRFEASTLPGPFWLASYTRNDTTGPAIDLALQVLGRLHTEGLTADQIASARAYLKGQAPERLESSDQLAARLARLEAHGLDAREIDEYYRRLDAVTGEDARRVIRDYFPRDNLVFVLIGKAAEIQAVAAKYAPRIELGDISQPGYGVRSGAD